MPTPYATVDCAVLLGPGLQRNLALADRSVKMMLKQVGMKRAIESGKFDDDMLASSVALMKHTGSFKVETDNDTFISLRRIPGSAALIVTSPIGLRPLACSNAIAHRSSRASQSAHS